MIAHLFEATCVERSALEPKLKSPLSAGQEPEAAAGERPSLAVETFALTQCVGDQHRWQARRAGTCLETLVARPQSHEQ